MTEKEFDIYFHNLLCDYENDAYSIVIEGKRFVTNNGKSSWRTKGFAMSAFKCALFHKVLYEYCYKNGIRPMYKVDDSTRKLIWESFMKDLETNHGFKVIKLEKKHE